MPRVRRRGHQQSAAFSRELYHYLLTGFVFSPFEKPPAEELRAGWLRWRDELLAEKGRPGERPWSYFVYELNMPEPSNWHVQIRVLMEQDLMPPAEIAAVESDRPALGAGAASEAVIIAEYIRRLDTPSRNTMETGMERYSELRREATELEFLSWWHERRGRRELAERFQGNAEAAAAALVADTAARREHQAAHERFEVDRALRGLERSTTNGREREERENV